jgi:hypothetical protein
MWVKGKYEERANKERKIGKEKEQEVSWKKVLNKIVQFLQMREILKGKQMQG